MRICKKDVIYYEFESFRDRGVVHCFSSRIGGSSKGYYSEMNLGLYSDEDRGVVETNYRLLCSIMDMNVDNIAYLGQVHKGDVFIIDSDIPTGIEADRSIYGYDAIITDKPGIVLTTFHVDCLPIYFFDNVKKVIGLAHSGWRGTLIEISLNVIKKMQEHYGTKVSDVFVGIGPGIDSCCFEVREDVFNKFYNGLIYSRPFLRSRLYGKYDIDLKAIVRQGLLNLGIRKDNIEVSNLCTACDEEHFYSHRRMGRNRGSMIAMLMIK